MKRPISLVTMGAGNVKVLKETLKSFAPFVDEFVYGDMLLFPEDRGIVKSYQKEFNLKIIELPFDYIFKNGFSSVLNLLISKASNDMCGYANTSEIVEIDFGINEIIDNNPECNVFYFTHATDPHRWFRFGDRRELHWSGVIHEQLGGEYKPYYKPIFQMADLPKDMDDLRKAKLFDTCKEIVYFHNYMKLVSYPQLLGETDLGWVKFAQDNYQSFKERLKAKGEAYVAYSSGIYEMLIHYFNTSPDFEKQKFESNIGIEYQNDKKYLL